MQQRDEKLAATPRGLVGALGFLCLLSLGVILALGLITSVRAAPEVAGSGFEGTDEPVRVYLDPSTVAMTRCGTIEMTVKVQAVGGLWGLQYVIQFDPNLLEVVDANPAKAGIQIYPAEVFAGKETFEAINIAATGRITYSVTMINPRDEAFFGSGSLGRIVFRPKIQSQATSLIRFEERSCALYNKSAENIPATWESAAVTKTVVCAPRYMFLPLLLRNRRMGS